MEFFENYMESDDPEADQDLARIMAATAHGALSEAASEARDTINAMIEVNEAIRLSGDGGPPPLYAQYLLRAAELETGVGMLDDGRRHVERARDICSVSRVVECQAWALSVLAMIERQDGEFPLRPERRWEEALELVDSTGLVAGNIFFARGVDRATHQRDTIGAISDFTNAVNEFERVGNFVSARSAQRRLESLSPP